MIHIVILHDNPALTSGFKALLRNVTSLALIATSSSSHDISNLLSNKNIDMILLSGNLDRLTETIREIRNQFQQIRILLMVNSFDEENIEIFNRVDADNLLLESIPKKELIEKIVAVHNGEESLPLEAQKILRTILQKRRMSEKKRIELTQREIEVLQCVGKGLDRKEIADDLKISINTVDGHLKNIFSKFEVHSLRQLEREARALGYFK